MGKWYTRPRNLQIGLVVAATCYLASLWLFPGLNPAVGLLAVLGLTLAAGIYSFVVVVRDPQAQFKELSQPGPNLQPGVPETEVSPLVISQPEQTETAAWPSDLAQAPASTLEDTRPNVVPSRLTQPALPPAAHVDLEGQSKSNGQKPGWALAQLRLARREAKRRGDAAAESAQLLAIAEALRHTGALRRAILYYQETLCLARQSGDRRREATVLGNLGLSHADLGQVQQAVDHYERQLALVRELGDRPGEARASWNLGTAYQALGHLADAVAAMQVCVDFEQEVHHPDAAPDAAIVSQLRARLPT